MTDQAHNILNLEAMRGVGVTITLAELETRQALADYSKALARASKRRGILFGCALSLVAKRHLKRVRNLAEVTVNRSSVHQRWVRQILLGLPTDVREQDMFPKLLNETVNSYIS